MRAMMLYQLTSLKENKNPLQLADIPVPNPGPGEVLIRVAACGVCHTELDEIEGRTPPKKLPVVLGHQAVGTVVKLGRGVKSLKLETRVGVAWIYSACGNCKFCTSGNENLCDEFRATGRDVNGGYAEYMVAPEKYVHLIPEFFSDAEAAPLLCAGAIGYRSIKLSQLKDGQCLGLTGFGASAHLVLKMVRFLFPNTSVYVFARNPEERKFAVELGAAWAGDTSDKPPVKLDCIIDTTPAWKPVVEALCNLEKGGRLIINAIRKENTDKDYLIKLSYPDHLWLEKEVKSVANVTSRDVSEFLALAAAARIRPKVKEYPLEAANSALIDLKNKQIRGAKVLVIS
ncbi:zinc-dependent alcohol dehydrogenase family protein [Lentiprolixibacter aurantiacus]|uniref:Zinc-dependent alcohol dehydrogenase family protein n=1 Tax=Lentiprolixibacter aurantiacus TaxID=2993939 RepID=A0AAE3SNR7_9FLAO|nr:zinc-dependent alcohol dehydrogenase family protein [Lentiprolixibacter aurantiacus]MCX2719924.1 zinc-dependent alcohol dehydrogenase family protein [Lentiprolixibacter aurantiacus]